MPLLQGKDLAHQTRPAEGSLKKPGEWIISAKGCEQKGVDTNLKQPKSTSPEKRTIWFCYLCPWHRCNLFWKHCVHNSREVVEKLEKVQRKATRMMKGVENIPCSERCKELNLFRLSERHLKGYLITAYK